MKYLRAVVCLAVVLALVALTACRPGPAADAGSGAAADAGLGQEGSAPASGEEDGQGAAAMSADEIAARAKILDDYILDQQERYGWEPGDVTYEDEGYLAIVTFASTAAAGKVDWEKGHEQLDTQEEADTLATDLGSVVCIKLMTSEGYLMGAYVGMPPEAAGADFDRASARIDEIEEDAAWFANQHRDSWYTAVRSFLVDDRGYGDVKYATSDDGAIAIGIQSPEGRTSLGMEGEMEEDFQKTWQNYAYMATLQLDSDVDVLFLSAETMEVERGFSAEKQSYISGLSAAYWERLGGGGA
jgi:hypothetical protein